MTRYIALDAFRGLTIALMILVNTPGSWDFVYAPLLHANWHGATPTDLVFPFFLFIIGSAMFFSYKKTNFVFSSAQVSRLLKRALIMFFIGLALNAYPFVTPFDELRILGVLQRIAIAYFFAGLLILFFNRRGIFISSIVILLGYWLLMLSVGSDQAYTLEYNIIRQFDVFILGNNHMWGGKGLPFDPEGLLSTIPAVVNVLIGFEITRIVSRINDKNECVVKLLKIGVVGIALSLLWDTVMPLNKSLWTSSYVIFSSAIACFVLAVFIYLIDIKNCKKPVVPLLVYGTNPMFIYVLSWLWTTTYFFISIDGVDLYAWLFNALQTVFNPTLASFVFALSHVVLFWFISQQLYKRKIFIKI
ncbi:MAG: putative acyltransferase [Alteromonadaceae bacterium]